MPLIWVLPFCFRASSPRTCNIFVCSRSTLIPAGWAQIILWPSLSLFLWQLVQIRKQRRPLLIWVSCCYLRKKTLLSFSKSTQPAKSTSELNSKCRYSSSHQIRCQLNMPRLHGEGLGGAMKLTPRTHVKLYVSKSFSTLRTKIWAWVRA